MMLSGTQNLCRISGIIRRRPGAQARVKGSAAYPDICGVVSFFENCSGVIVTADFIGLPISRRAYWEDGVFGLHIHEGGAAAAIYRIPMRIRADTSILKARRTPYHAGDMPPLFEITARHGRRF
jgi:Cu-Zn family superoxide dismutase